MTHFSAILIVPADLLGKANALGAALGHGPDSYTVPLGADDAVTHYGSRSRVLPIFIATLAAAGAVPPEELERLGVDPDLVSAGGEVVAGLDLAAHGLTEADRDAVIASLIWGFEPEGSVDPAQHFADVAADLPAPEGPLVVVSITVHNEIAA
ncbi:hypothetical protein ACR03S_10025 [Limimaricola variabilis]